MIYFYDGSKDSFLTAFLLAYSDEEAYLTSENCQLSLGQKTVFVRADRSRATRAEERLCSFDRDCMDDLNLLLRSGEADRGQVAFRYLKLLTERKRPIRNMLAENAVLDADEHIRRVTGEIHRMKGFVRFMESNSGALYAPITPDNDICDLLLPHFRARIPTFPFVIHDIRRKKAAVYDGANSFCAPLERAEILLAADESAWQALWKNYFEHVNIVSRERLKQQRGYLPVRYRKFMPEFH